jgi:hypothetical protein
LSDGHWRVHRADVHQRTALAAVDVGVGQGLGMIQVQDEVNVGRHRGLIRLRRLLVAEGHPLPVLALVLAEVEDLEGLAVRDAEQALAGGVDREAAEVAADPAAVEFFGDR